jgi:inorganic pyrophosphatase
MTDSEAKRAPRKTGQVIDLVIETPKGSRCKYEFDPKARVFRLKHILPAGAVFPYDFGFIPKTLADDGDPLDVLVLLDVPTFAGCMLEVRLIGVLEAEQSQEGEMIRNDRLIAVAEEAKDHGDLHSLKDINEHLLQELEHFFVSYNEARGISFRVIARKGPRAASRLYREARRRAGRKKA